VFSGRKLDLIGTVESPVNIWFTTVGTVGRVGTVGYGWLATRVCVARFLPLRTPVVTHPGFSDSRRYLYSQVSTTLHDWL